MNRFLEICKTGSSETMQRTMRTGYGLLIAAGLDESFVSLYATDQANNTTHAILETAQLSGSIIGLVGSFAVGISYVTRAIDILNADLDNLIEQERQAEACTTIT